MQLTIDLILLAVFGVLVFIGWWRGFLKSVLGFGKLVLSFILTILLGPVASAWIDKTLVNPPVYASVHQKLTDLADEVSATARGGADALTEKIPAVFKNYLDLQNVDPTADIHALADEWSLTVAGGISKVIATVIGYVAVFVIAFILLTIAIWIATKLIHQIDLLRTTDKILGALLGAASGAVAVLLVSTVLGAILSVLGKDAVVEGSFMLRLSAWIRNLIFS
jgi:uncharacterized membrane protein required for colicin V production